MALHLTTVAGCRCGVSLVCGEWCREKRRVAPDRVLPADPQVVAGVYRQCRDVLQELLELYLLLAELVEGLQPVGVVLGHHPARSHLKGRDVGRQVCDVGEEVGVFVFLLPMGIGEGFCLYLSFCHSSTIY